MKKFLILLCTAALMCFVACEKEGKEKTETGGNEETEQPGQPADTVVPFNQFAPIRIPVVEDGRKAEGHYDALTIYNNATEIWMMQRGNSLPFPMPMVAGEYQAYRDTVRKQLAIKGLYALHKPSEIDPYELGPFPSFRNVVLEMRFNEDGSVFDLTPWADLTIEEWIDPNPHPRRDDFDEKYYFGNLRRDTVAYIPNAVMDSLEPLMEQAFLKGQEIGNWKELFEIFDNGYKFIPVTGEEYMELVRQGIN
ncbi:MAG: hypothetical protein NC048_10010 [Bacteroides sp.]|nr:hypothetical protein [Bacteroides sp.]